MSCKNNCVRDGFIHLPETGCFCRNPDCCNSFISILIMYIQPIKIKAGKYFQETKTLIKESLCLCTTQSANLSQEKTTFKNPRVRYGNVRCISKMDSNNNFDCLLIEILFNFSLQNRIIPKMNSLLVTIISDKVSLADWLF